MNTTLSLESILHMLSGLSLSNRQWLAEHLVEPKEMERAIQRKSDEQLVRDLQALHYEGEPTAEERKKMLRDSHYFGGRKKGKPVDEFDIVIAGHASSEGLTVVTDNLKHFENMPDVKIENWLDR